MIQTGSVQIDALIKELEAQYLGLLESNAQKAGELAGLQQELAALKAEIEGLRIKRKRRSTPSDEP